MRQGAWFALAAAVACGISAASAQHQHPAPPPCAGADLACATAATPAFAADGSLGLASAAGGHVMAALAFAWAKDGGASVAAARIAQDQTCECCRLAIGFAGTHRPVIAFRNIFDGTTRDHAVMTFADATTPGPVRRISVDDWKTNVCPHQGPALAIADGVYHVAWFTNGQASQDVVYGRQADRGASF